MRKPTRSCTDDPDPRRTLTTSLAAQRLPQYRYRHITGQPGRVHGRHVAAGAHGVDGKPISWKVRECVDHVGMILHRQGQQSSQWLGKVTSVPMDRMELVTPKGKSWRYTPSLCGRFWCNIRPPLATICQLYRSRTAAPIQFRCHSGTAKSGKPPSFSILGLAPPPLAMVRSQKKHSSPVA